MSQNIMATKTKKCRLGARGVRKVKTGCLTCKYTCLIPAVNWLNDLIECRIRRKKCNEIKPACSQCLETGRQCDFLLLPRPLDIAQTLSSDFGEHAMLHFEYFKTICIPEFSLYFEDPVWERIVLQAATTEPCMQHAALAIGALSRSQYDIAAFSLSASEYSVTHYSLAIQALREHLEYAQNSELAVLGTLLFVVIEMLFGDDNRVAALVRSSFALINIRPGNNLEYLWNALSRVDNQVTAFLDLQKSPDIPLAPA